MKSTQAGVTMVELIIAIVVVAISVTGVLGGLAVMVGRSADPMLQAQSLGIADSYMNEILNKPYLDPDTGFICDATTPPATDRPLYDNVCDYQGIALDTVVRDQFYNTIAELSNYSVQVTVTTNSGSELHGITAADAIRVDITVTDPKGDALTLVGYRSRY